MFSVDFAKWFLNGTLVSSVSNLMATRTSYQVNDTTKLYIVTFPTRDENVHILNYGLITCRGYYDNVHEKKFILTSLSQSALLLIQGIFHMFTCLYDVLFCVYYFDRGKQASLMK